MTEIETAHLKAIHQIRHDGKIPILPGDIFEVTVPLAIELIDSGAAQLDEPDAAPVRQMSPQEKAAIGRCHDVSEHRGAYR